MAMSALEIAAVFSIKDDASAPLSRIANSLKAMSDQLKIIVDQTQAATEKLAGVFTKIDTGIKGSIEQTNALAAAWDRVAIAAGRAATAGNVSGAHPSRNILGFRPKNVEVPGAGHFHGSTGAMIGAGVGAYSIYEAVRMEDTASRGLASVFPEGLPKDFDSKRDELIRTIVKESQITGLPLQTTAMMSLEEIKTNANMSWQQRMRIMPQVLETAAREAYIKDVDPLETTKALVGQLHQTKSFTPEEIAKNAPMLAYFASKDPNALTNIGKSSAYHTPIATSMMGIPIEQDLAAQVVLDRTGVGGKSGTWLREMVTRAAKPIHDKHFDERVAALKGFGLSDAEGNPTWMTDGHYDESKLLHILNDKLRGVPIAERESRLKSVFGERGAGAVALMSDDPMLKQYDSVLAEARGVTNNADFWKQQNAANPAQAFKGAWVDLQTVLLDIGTKALPPVVTGLNALDAVLKSLGPKGQSGAVTGGLVGGAAGAAVGGVPGAIVGGAAGAAIGGDATRSNKMVGGGFLGAAEDLYRLFNLGFGTKAHADELPSTFSDRFGSWPSTGKQSYNVMPPKQSKVTFTNQTNLNIDGNMLASAISNQLALMFENSPNAPGANDLSDFDANGGLSAG